MKRTELHFGQMVFLEDLDSTSMFISIDRDLQNLVGTYVKVYEFCGYDNNCITILHPTTGKEYHISCSDLSLTDTTFKNMDLEKPVLKIPGKQTMFDEKLLNL